MSDAAAIHASALANSGRAASRARRLALSAGKSALPPPTERLRDGERSASVPVVVAATTSAAPPPAAVPHEPPPATSASTPGIAALGGRRLSMERRRQLSSGKAGLPAASSNQPSPRETSAAPAVIEACSSAPEACAHASCREQARLRRRLLSQQGRGDQPAAGGIRPARPAATSVLATADQPRAAITGHDRVRGSAVTGGDSGSRHSVSGTPDITPGAVMNSAAARKVGLMRTGAGLVVSGTLLRSQVAITGDEAGSGLTITGTADASLDDDLTPRSGFSGLRQHGMPQAFRNAAGSRERSRQARIERTDAGLAITGVAVGRSSRVSGDEAGACRSITGDQYLAASRYQAECGGSGGGTSAAELLDESRRDPVTRSKVQETLTFAQQRVTGPALSHHGRVSGGAAGNDRWVTGTPYQRAAAGAPIPARNAMAVTGDAPRPGDAVTGMARGAGRGITGTRYWQEPAAAAEAADHNAIDHAFSVQEPQRAARLRARAEVDAAAPAITGSFTRGDGRITGNLEFQFRPRRQAEAGKPAAHARVSGEGRSQGPAITGQAWTDSSRVTGTEGSSASTRNPSERSGKPQAFAGARNFKPATPHEPAPLLVTGLLGWSSNTSARVTLSGGAPS